MKRLTQQEFITKAEQAHGTTYDYSKTIYKNNRADITIICKLHGEFSQKAQHHLNGAGCPACGNISKSRKMTKSLDSFIESANKVHNKYYTYKNSIYTGIKNKITITCPKHGNFTQAAESHLQGRGCHECAKEKPKIGRRFTIDQFLEKAKKAHGDRYSYNKVKYTTKHNKVIITCPIHGDFEQVPYTHWRGSGCPSCSVSGYKTTLPGYLYYLSINNGQAYKIGITNKTVQERFTVQELSIIKVIKVWEYENGEECLKAEQRILSEYSNNKYKGPDLLESGNTELFHLDVLNLDEGG